MVLPVIDADFATKAFQKMTAGQTHITSQVTVQSTIPTPIEEPSTEALPTQQPDRILGVVENTYHVGHSDPVRKGENSRIGRDAKKAPISHRTATIALQTSQGVMKKELPLSVWDLGHMIYSPLTIYQSIQHALLDEGYRLEYDPYGGGLYSNHRVFSVSSPSQQPGINYPDGFKTLQPVPVSRANKLSGAIQTCIKRMMTTAKKLIETTMGSQVDGGVTLTYDFPNEPMQYGGKDGDDVEKQEAKHMSYLYQKIMGVWGNFELFNPLASQCGVMMANEVQAFHSPISVDGLGVSNRYVPDLKWFDPQLSEIEDEQLLSLIPDAEREAFMLQLGRAMLGREGTPLTNGNVQPLKWRGVSLFEGRVGGMGRSTLLEYLDQGFKKLGYHCGSMQDLTGKFGHGRGATTDFGYQDDLSPDGTITALSSPILKSMSSGGTFTAEEKGQQSRQVTSMGTYLLCTNRFDLTKLHQLDPGNLSRLMPMRNACPSDTRSKEFREKYGCQINTDHIYNKLSQDYGVPIDTLVMLLLARSAAKFRPFVDAGDQMGLVNRLEELREQFLIKTDLSYVDDLLGHYVELYAWSHTFSKPSTLTMKHMVKCFQVSAQSGIQIPGVSDTPSMILDYTAACLGSGRKGQATLAKSFMECLSSSTGMSYPTSIPDLSQRFHQCVESVDISHVKDAYRKKLDGVELTDHEKKMMALSSELSKCFS